jgi:hypothetical protein
MLIEGRDWPQACVFNDLQTADRGVAEAPESIVFVLDARTRVRYQQSMCLDLGRLASSEWSGFSRVVGIPATVIQNAIVPLRGMPISSSNAMPALTM